MSNYVAGPVNEYQPNKRMARAAFVYSLSNSLTEFPDGATL